MLERLKNEPAMVYSLVEAIIAFTIAIVASLGVDIPAEVVASFLGIVAVLTGVGVRQSAYGPKTVDQIKDAEYVIRSAEGNSDVPPLT